MKITYRPIAENDLKDRVRWFNDPEISRYFGPEIRNGSSLSKQCEWYKKLIESKDRKDYAIEIDKKPVGNIGMVEINKIDGNAGLYIFIGDKEYWGRGVAAHSLKFITDYGFNKLKLHKIWLHVYGPNIRAIKCYEKFGFIIEGRHSEMVKLDGKFHDEIFMSITNPYEVAIL